MKKKKQYFLISCKKRYSETLTIYLYKNKSTSYKQYLFGLLFPGKPKNTLTDQSTLQVFTSV